MLFKSFGGKALKSRYRFLLVMVKIIFLGVAGGRYATSKQLLETGGFVIKTNERTIAVDPGAGALVNLAKNKIDIEEITDIVITHNHVDHCSDVNVLINGMTHGGRIKKGTLIANEELFDHENSCLMKQHVDWFDRIVKLEKGKQVRISNDFGLEPIETKHSISGFGIKFFFGNLTIAYSSDTEFSKNIVGQYKGSGVLILNVMRPRDLRVAGHLCSDDVETIINEVRPKLTLMTHFGIKMIEANPLYEARRIQRNTRSNVVAAHDGLILDPESYSADGPQSMLSEFLASVKDKPIGP